MAQSVRERLVALKGFTFDGQTNRHLSDLYQAIEATGCTKDAPFVAPLWSETTERPAVANSYLDPEGKRVVVVWHSDESGTSCVEDILFDAEPLLKREPSCSCEACGDICLAPAEGGEKNA